MGNLVTDHVEVDMLGTLRLLKQMCHSAASSTKCGRLCFIEVADPLYVPLRLDDKLSPVGRRPGQGMYMSDVDEIIFKEDATLGAVAETMLLADEALS
jgi:hypothetical protein